MIKFFVNFAEHKKENYKEMRGIITQLAKRDYDKILTEKLNGITGNPVFGNDFSDVFVKKSELAGYHYLTFIFAGKQLYINTTIGCEVIFEGSGQVVNFRSESEIVDGDYSELSDIGIAQFDIDFPDELYNFVLKNGLDKVTLKTKNGQFFKRKVEFQYTKIDQALFLEILKPVE